MNLPDHACLFRQLKHVLSTNITPHIVQLRSSSCNGGESPPLSLLSPPSFCPHTPHTLSQSHLSQTHISHFTCTHFTCTPSHFINSPHTTLHVTLHTSHPLTLRTLSSRTFACHTAHITLHTSFNLILHTPSHFIHSYTSRAFTHHISHVTLHTPSHITHPHTSHTLTLHTPSLPFRV